MKPVPEQPRPLPPVEPDIDTILQKEEPAAEESSLMPGVTQPIPTNREPISVAELTSSERPSQPTKPDHVTMRYANSLLEDSHFEEALHAFLELSHKS